MNFFVFYSKWAAIMAIHSNIKVGVEEVINEIALKPQD